MKKIISIPLVIVYSLLTMGLYFHAHYCGDELASFKLFTKAEKACGCSEAEDMDDCCKDVSTWLKLKDDQQSKITSIDFNKSFVLLTFQTAPDFNSNFDFSNNNYIKQANPPPLLHIKTPLTIFNRILII